MWTRQSAAGMSSSHGKLHDFEDYMRSLGVDVDLTGQPGARKPPRTRP